MNKFYKNFESEILEKLVCKYNDEDGMPILYEWFEYMKEQMPTECFNVDTISC